VQCGNRVGICLLMVRPIVIARLSFVDEKITELTALGYKST
jgi:hypothetical protein